MTVELLNSNQGTKTEDNNFTNTDAELAVIGCILWDNKNYEKMFMHLLIYLFLSSFLIET